MRSRSLPLLLAILATAGSSAFAQVYSDDQLLDEGDKAYQARRYPAAIKFLFAYKQRSPELLVQDTAFAARLEQCLSVAERRINDAIAERDTLRARIAQQADEGGAIVSGLEAPPPRLDPPRHHQAGRDDTPPRKPTMGPLVEGLAYRQADYRSASVASADDCSALCRDEERCVAMTFVVSQKLCWLKDSVPATANHRDYISAVKVYP